MRLPFTKMQGVGNDFVVVEGSVLPSGTDLPALALRLCDRKFGIGSDGLLVLLPSSVSDLRMRMFNPDGTEDMCGNGLRCIIRLARQQGIIGDVGTVETLSGVREFSVGLNGVITAEMGAPNFDARAIPACFPANASTQTVSIAGVPLRLHSVNTGSTHTVLWRERLPEDSEFFALSPLIEEHPLFPKRTSVMWAAQDGANTIHLRIWERGAGETLGCGTGACAVAAVARREGRWQEGPLLLRSKGGALSATWSGRKDDSIYLTGDAQTVFTGEIEV